MNASVSTPYRFVPLSQLIVLPDWGERVSHDHPFHDGLCGELSLTLTCHQPVCVGGEQEKASDRQPGKVCFYRTPDGELAIPGSSLKGMIRNVMEIASFARFRQVEDQRLGVRDLSEADNFYVKAIVKRPVHAGWLRFDAGQWTITPCEFSRIHQGELIRRCNVSESSWSKTRAAQERYGLIGLLPKTRFETESHKTKKRIVAVNSDGPKRGCIVVTGQPGSAFNAPNNKRSKKYEFVFHLPQDDVASGKPLAVTDPVMQGFQHIHQDSDEWAFWRSKLGTRELEHGIPVFYHDDNKGGVASLGLAMMYKLPYAHSVHEALSHASARHLQPGAADLPDLLFGRLGDDTGGSLRGRVAFGMAALQGAARTEWLGPTVLANPKPGFYPAYVRQDNPGAFRQLMENDSQLAGWKRYPARPVKVPPPPEKSGAKVQVKLEAVAGGARFQCKVRVHNLRRVELGALLWALDFGGNSELRHGLGVGKPLGLGQVSLACDGWALQPNDTRVSPQDIDATWLDACRLEFARFMEHAFEAVGASTTWVDSGPVKALHEFATPATDTAGLEYLPAPKEFTGLKTKESLNEIRSKLHGFQGVTIGSANTDLPHPFTVDFEQCLQQVREEKARAIEQQELEQRRQAASGEQRILIELEGALGDLGRNGSSKTVLEKINRCLRDCHDRQDRFDDKDRECLDGLVARCRAIDNKKIAKACKKFDAAS